MTAQHLEVAVRHQPRIATIDLYGQIDSLGEQSLNTAYVDASSRSPDAILLNFTDVDYMNSTGIALIVSLLAQARQSGTRLMAYGLSDHYVEIFQITRLADFINIFPNEAAALASI